MWGEEREEEDHLLWKLRKRTAKINTDNKTMRGGGEEKGEGEGERPLVSVLSNECPP